MGFFGKLIGSVVGDVVGGVLDKAADNLTATVKNKLDEILPTTTSTYTEKEIDNKKIEREEVKKVAVEEVAVEEVAVKKVAVKKVAVKEKSSNKEWEVNQLQEAVLNVLEKLVPLSKTQKLIRAEISPAEIAGIQPYKNYSFGVYEEGKPILFIMVTQHNRGNKFFRGAKKAAENAKVPFENFYTQFANTDEYIENRLRGYIEF